jgi:spore coat protein A
VFRRVSIFLLLFISLFFVSRAWVRGPDFEKASIFTMGFQKFVDPLPIPPRLVIAPGTTDVVITLDQFKTKLHRDLPDTTTWGYNGSTPGPTIEVERGQLVRVHWKDQLPTQHLFAVPKGADMGDGSVLPDVRNVTHLHGAVVSEPDPMNRQKNNDGWPDAWIVPGQEQMAEYPNDQTARNLWYHDHAVGETGRNVAAGLAGLYIIHDKFERSLNLPSGAYDIPLILEGRGLNTDGTMYYTNDISIEYYGNSVSVNGKLWPYLNVEPRKYRFRVLNSSNARTFALKLLDQMGQAPGPSFYQIGSDGGFLQDTVQLNDPTDPDALRLTVAPAERADVIIDFSTFAGHTLYLNNNSLDPGDGEIPIPQVMMVKVGTAVTTADTTQIPTHLQNITRFDPAHADHTRRIVLSELDVPNMVPMLQLNGLTWRDPIQDKPVLGSTEVWELLNTLPDSHPFHIHLVEFQILDRRPFDVAAYKKDGSLQFTGPAETPDPNEMGWKDTVRVVPQMMTRIMMRFQPYAGYYVYHCHILEHEDMDMMRPFQIVPGP